MDALSEASDSFYGGSSSNHSSSMFYDATDANGNPIHFSGTKIDKNSSNYNIENEGFYCTWNLPDDVEDALTINYVQIYAQAKCQLLNPDAAQSIIVHIKYVHAQSILFSLNAKYEWTNSGKIGVKLDNFGETKTDYYFTTAFNYVP